MPQNFPDNTLYEMDNLIVLRGMNSETIDLIATDPPFNTKRNRSSTAGHYVDNWKWGDTGILPDQWKWNEIHPKWLEEIKDNNPILYSVIETSKKVQGEDTAAFLCFLSVRFLEMHRILKDTGSIYLHCDPTASHYIKMCMDAVFGKKNFRNEIVWAYTGPGSPGMKQFNRKHDTIFWYNKGDSWIFNNDAIRIPHKRLNTNKKGAMITAALTPEERDSYLERGKVPETWWPDFSPVGRIPSERTGSPDQKPISLYERIIKASSKEGDIVLDPFCGCATTIIAANNLNRRWIGIDRRKDARYHIITRLMGINQKERERINQYALDQEWLDNQMQKYEMCYELKSPIRTDEPKYHIPELGQVYATSLPENPHTHNEMKKILIENFGIKCWGCNFIPPSEDYLELDHISPKSEGGSNLLFNRALLCSPCNKRKLNTKTLDGLHKHNKRNNFMKSDDSIDLKQARTWTEQYTINAVHEMKNQRELNFDKIEVISKEEIKNKIIKTDKQVEKQIPEQMEIEF